MSQYDSRGDAKLTGHSGPLPPPSLLAATQVTASSHGGLDAWGMDATAPHYAGAWAWAGNAPFQWGKQVV